MKSRGRPKKYITWPENVEFTTKDIRESSTERLSSGLIHIKIKEALASGEIQLVRKTSTSSKGRPKNVYRKTQ
jgi:hypothetical protein